MTREKVIEIGIAHLKRYGIKYRLISTKDGGQVLCRENMVLIGTVGSPAAVASTIMHEITHILLYRKRKYYTYHHFCTKNPRKTVKTLKVIIRTWLKAERYTDKIASSLMETHFPGIGYQMGYDDEISTEIVHEWMEPLKEIVRRNS